MDAGADLKEHCSGPGKKMDQMSEVQSAQRTNDNSPAIHHWVRFAKRGLKPAKRAAEILHSAREANDLLSPALRAPEFLLVPLPSTKVLGYYRSSASRTNNSTWVRVAALSLLIIPLIAVSSCQRQVARAIKPLKPPEQQTETRALPANSSPDLKLVIASAIEQVGKTTSYDPSYQRIEYPNGDVPIETGVCSDVIVRAFRAAGIDLQKEVHEDMKEHFSAYPTRWGLSGPDANIDHRRVPNLQTYLTRKGKSLATTTGSENFLPGDVVTWDLSGGYDHVGMVVNVWYRPTQHFLVVHNIGCCGTHMDDSLFAWKITGHYRYW